MLLDSLRVEPFYALDSPLRPSRRTTAEERGHNPGNNALEALEYLVLPESQHPPACSLQCQRLPGVARNILRELLAPEPDP